MYINSVIWVTYLHAVHGHLLDCFNYSLILLDMASGPSMNICYILHMYMRSENFARNWVIQQGNDDVKYHLCAQIVLTWMMSDDGRPSLMRPELGGEPPTQCPVVQCFTSRPRRLPIDWCRLYQSINDRRGLEVKCQIYIDRIGGVAFDSTSTNISIPPHINLKRGWGEFRDPIKLGADDKVAWNW